MPEVSRDQMIKTMFRFGLMKDLGPNNGGIMKSSSGGQRVTEAQLWSHYRFLTAPKSTDYVPQGDIEKFAKERGLRREFVD